MKYEVIENFLDEEYFDNLVTLFTGCNQSSWFLTTEISNPNVVEEKFFYMTHMLYDKNMPVSPHYDKLFPLLGKLEANHLLRAKANLYPNSETLQEHQMHVDFDYSHSGAILSLNTCDGYTKLKDGTKINSVANRVLLFDASEEHCSTTTTNVSARINININYIQEEQKKNASTQTFDY